VRRMKSGSMKRSGKGLYIVKNNGTIQNKRYTEREMQKKKQCFIIMPFSETTTCTEEQWTDIYENIHKSAINGSMFGYKSKRSEIRTGAFIKDILMQLNHADVVLADLTDMNPNVFYELGVRHTLRNRTILVSQTMDDVPSDLKQYGVITYKTTPSGVNKYKKEIKKFLKHIRNNPDRPDNPVSDYLISENIVTDSFEAKTIEKKLNALISECSYNLLTISSIIKIVDQEIKATTSARFRTGAIELLTTTCYIYPTEEYIILANHLLSYTTTQNGTLDLLKSNEFRNSAKEEISKSYPEYKKNWNHLCNKHIEY